MANPSHTVLVIDNSAENCRRYQADLTREPAFAYEVLTQPSVNHCLQGCPLGLPDVILLGLEEGLEDLPTVDFTLLDQLALGMGSQCPPIVVVGSQQVQVAVQAIKHGAADYLVRDQMTGEDLRHTLRSAIENAQLKQQLQISQERFQTSVENLMDCFGIFTAIRDDTGRIVDFRIDYVNRAACEKNRLPREQQIGRGLCEILPGHIDSGLFDAYCHLVETGEPVIKDSVIFEDSCRGSQQMVRAFDIRATKLNDGFVASWRDITDRKRLELELNYTVTSLQQEQQRLKQLIDEAPVGIGIGSPSGKVEVINDAMLQLYGLDRPTFEQRGMNWRDFIPPDRQNQIEHLLEQLQQTGQCPSQAWEIVSANGQRVPLWISANHLSDGTDHYVAFAINLTQLKQTQATLHNERQLRRALDSLFCFVGLMTPDGTLIDVNRTALEAAGLTLDDVINRPFEATHWWSHSPQVQVELRRAITQAAQGQTVRYDVEVRLRDDQYIVIDFALVPLFDGQGQVEYLVPSGIDVTHRKRVEASLLDSQNQLQRQLAELENIYQSVPIGLNVLDRDLRFVRINQLLAEINGLPVADHVGRTVQEVLPDLADVAEQMLRPILETGEPLLNVEIRGETPAQPGVERIWLEHFLPIKQGDQVIGINTVCQEITQQKQAELERQQREADLQASEARFRLLAETIQDVFWMTDCRIPQVLYVSPAFETIWGQSPEAIYRDHAAWLETVHPEDRDIVLNCLAKLEFEDAIELEYRIIRPNGEIRWIRDRGFTLRNEASEPQQTMGIAQDMTQYKQIELALRQATERLDMGMKVAGFGLAQIDYVTDQVSLSPEAAILYGMDPDQVVVSRQRLHATFHPWDREALEQLIQQVLEPTGPGWFAQDHRVVWPNGEVRWLSVRKQVFFDTSQPSPRPSHGILVALDITQRKRDEKSLRRSEERYRTLFKTMEDGFCVLEMIFDADNHPVDYRFLELNPAFEQHTGLRQAAGKTARQMLPDLEEHWFEIYGRVALTGEPVRFENGSEVMNRWFEVYAFRLGGDTSRKVALLFKDISDRKAMETQREQLLRQEQAAREAAERANRVKDEFLAILSHELRSPLNPILGWSRLLQTRQLDNAKTQWALSTIERNAKLQTQLIDDLLDIARILRGKLKLEHRPVNLIEAIEAALDTVRTTATAKSITLNFTPPPYGQVSTLSAACRPLVSGDYARLQQIVWNLLSNAIKFTPNGGRVEVRLEAVREPESERAREQAGEQGSRGAGEQGSRLVGLVADQAASKGLAPQFPSPLAPQLPVNYACITITDTGQGISPDFLPHIFESFRQEDVSITRKHGGLGLGLSIVRYLVEAHGGTIAADSPGEGQGATFCVQLPLLPADFSEPITVSSSQTPSLAGLRIMAIDDEADARTILEAILEFHGAEVLVLDNSTEFLSQLPVFRPQILICDLGMPRVDGYSLIQRVRNLTTEQGGDTPAIALTAYAREEDKERTLNSGFQCHMAKPFDLEELVRVVAEIADPCDR